MLRCKEITELVSKKMDTSISWQQKMELTVHLFICKRCRRYAKQLAFLQQAFIKSEVQQKQPSLSEEAKQRIQKKLESVKFD